MNYFTDEELERIVMSVIASRGDEGATEVEIQQVVDRLWEMRVGAQLLDLLFLGHIDVSLKDGEVVWRNSEMKP